MYIDSLIQFLSTIDECSIVEQQEQTDPNIVTIHLHNSNILLYVNKQWNNQNIQLNCEEQGISISFSIRDQLLDGLCTIVLFNNDSITQNWNSGLLNGKYIISSGLDRLYEAEYENGKLTGTTTYYSFSTGKKEKVVYSDDVQITEKKEDDDMMTVYYTTSQFNVINNVRILCKDTQITYNCTINEANNFYTIDENAPDNSFISKKIITDDVMKIMNLNGLVYEGSYIFVKPGFFIAHGAGKQYNNGVLYYAGNFNYGLRSGIGTLYFNNGKPKYTGQWKEDMPWGDGQLFDKDSYHFLTIHSYKGIFKYRLKDYDVYTYLPIRVALGINYADNTAYHYMNQSKMASIEIDSQCKRIQLQDLTQLTTYSYDQIEYTPKNMLKIAKTFETYLFNHELSNYSPYSIKKITISATDFTTSSVFDCYCFQCIEELVIEQEALQHIETVTIQYFIHLQSIQFLQGSCSKATCSIRCLPSLKTLKFDRFAFNESPSLLIECCNQLQTLIFGPSTFDHITKLQLNHLFTLTSLFFGQSSFYNLQVLEIAFNPLLKVITVDSNCLPSLLLLHLHRLLSLEMIMSPTENGVYTPKLTETSFHLNAKESFAYLSQCNFNLDSPLYDYFIKLLNSDLLPLSQATIRQINPILNRHTSIQLSQLTSEFIPLFKWSSFPNVQCIRLSDGFDTMAETITIASLQRLQWLEIKDNCFNMDNKSRKLIIQDLPSLKKISIGANCFIYTHDCLIANLTIGTKSFSVYQDPIKEKSLVLSSLNQLESFCLQRNTFTFFTSCILQGLDNITIIDIDTNCFTGLCNNIKQCLDIKDLTSLTNVRISAFSFTNFTDASFENLPQLTSVTIASNCFNINAKRDTNGYIKKTNLSHITTLVLGDIDNSNESFSQITELLIQDLPLLESISIGSACFPSIQLFDIYSLKSS